MLVMRRRTLLIGAALLAAGCGGGAASGGATPDDIVLGANNAPVTLIEYFSVACPICKIFHQTVFNQLKTNYIDTGKVKMILREVPTHDGRVAVAGFQIARCGGASVDQYVSRVGVMFDQQDILDGPRQESDEKLFEIGRSSGLTDDQITACLNDPAGAARNNRNADALTQRYGSWGTPLLELNGRRLQDQSDYTYAGLSHTIDAAIAATGQH